MKAIRIYFETITQLRKMEHALNFVGVPYTVNDEELSLAIDKQDLGKRDDLKLEISSTSASIAFRNKP